MAFQLPELPYEKNALEPHISAETLEYHHDKHHKAYVDKLNSLVEGTDKADKSLEEIIKSSSGGLFNQAAQVWNHTFYWHCLSPNGGGAPTGAIAEAINKAFGSFDKFKEEFTASAIGNFASGWTWLVKKSDGSVAIVNTDDAETPVTDSSVTPLLTCDVWEHAYYIDYRNARPKYLEAYWNLVNWEFVNSNFAG
ncbi:superoxide dismutase [Allohahella marinimesophila]|uniref:Superoxide dismutase n=1 Tax=Allohahella marinimesophila TaxID=1054972 RepID=A0ABP7NST3_9GAMM